MNFLYMLVGFMFGICFTLAAVFVCDVIVKKQKEREVEE